MKASREYYQDESASELICGLSMTAALSNWSHYCLRVYLKQTMRPLYLLILDIQAAVSHELFDDVDDNLAALAHSVQALVREVVRDELDQGRRKGEQHQEHGINAEGEGCTDTVRHIDTWTDKCACTRGTFAAGHESMMPAMQRMAPSVSNV